MGKAARRSVASDPSSPTLLYQQPHHQQRPQQQSEPLVHQRQVPYYHPSPSLPYASPAWSSSPFASTPVEPFSSPSSSSSADPGRDSVTAAFASSSTAAATGPQLQAPRTATLQSAPAASSLAPAPSSHRDPPEAGSGASELFRIHSSTAATPTTNNNFTPEFSEASEAPGVTGPSLAPEATLLPSFRLSSNQTQVERERERLRMEFYATYDVMTGVRIAATLGGFFGLMVFLVIYKSRTRSTAKALKDPTIAAVAAAVIEEEEERELQEAIEATAFSLLQEELNINYPGLQRDRLMSLGNVSAPPMLSRGRRMSSISGGYSSLLNPSRRFSYSSTRGHRNSVSVSSRVLSAYNMGGSFGQDDYVLESDGEEADDEFDQFTTTAEIGYPSNYLSVPSKCNESRRSSAMTCCSTESSFLERRCSAITLGLSSLPPISRSPSRQQSRDDTADWEPFYPGINIIEPTPKSSPCPSERITHRGTALDFERPSTSRAGRSRTEPLPSTSGGVRTMSAGLSYEDSSIDCISEYPVGASFGQWQAQPACGALHPGRLVDPSIAGTAGRPMWPPGAPGDPSNSALISSISTNNTTTTVQPGSCSSAAGVVRRAPLASLSSFRMSSADCQDTEPKSCGSDSVFGEDSGADTDEDLQQFSTDSDELSLTMPYEEEEEGYAEDARGRSLALYRRQSTLAQCDDDDEDEEYAIGATVATVPAGRDAPSATYEVEQDERRRRPPPPQRQPTTDTSYLSSLSISNRSDSVGNRIETKAIIERQHPNDSSQQQQQQRQSPLGAIPKTSSPATVSVAARRGAPIVAVHAPPEADPRSSSGGRTRNSIGSVRGELEQKSSSERVTDSSSASTARQRNVEVNVIVKGSGSGSGGGGGSSAPKSPSVILELPILAIDDEDDPSSGATPANDPCIPGPSRKWSKETLF